MSGESEMGCPNRRDFLFLLQICIWCPHDGTKKKYCLHWQNLVMPDTGILGTRRVTSFEVMKEFLSFRLLWQEPYVSDGGHWRYLFNLLLFTCRVLFSHWVLFWLWCAGGIRTDDLKQGYQMCSLQAKFRPWSLSIRPTGLLEATRSWTFWPHWAWPLAHSYWTLHPLDPVPFLLLPALAQQLLSWKPPQYPHALD